LALPSTHSTVVVYVSHRISGRFEFSEHFCKNPVTGRMDGITPEARGGHESLIGVLRENFVHQNWHIGFVSF